MDNEAFWQSVACRLEAGRPVFAAFVVAHTRGSPGTRGARLLLDANGEVEGTIGGGIMEANLVEAARASLTARTGAAPQLQRLIHRKKGAGKQSGLICAGEQTNLSLLFEPERDAASVRAFCNAVADQASRSATLEIDAQGLHLRKNAAGSPSAGPHLIQEEQEWRYRESSLNPRRLVIAGGGHCGQALARLAAEIGYWVEVYDTRAEVLHKPGWPGSVRRHVLGNYAELRARLSHPALTTVVVMTATVYHDIEALGGVAQENLRWLGVMGSAAKIHKIRTELRRRRLSPACVAAIHGPIGLPMKSDTPPEIAVSIMGQLLTERPEEASS